MSELENKLREIIRYQFEAYGVRISPKDEFRGFILDLKSVLPTPEPAMSAEEVKNMIINISRGYNIILNKFWLNAISHALASRLSKPEAEKVKDIPIPEKFMCIHCEGDIRIRNPKGNCDHLYYPDNCKICQEMIKQENYLSTPQRIEPLEHDKLDIARVDPGKREFVLAIQKAINDLRQKQSQIIARLEEKG